MAKDVNYIKIILYKAETDRVADMKSNCLDFYLYCDPSGCVNKINCKDYKTLYKYINGKEVVLHKAMDFGCDIVNVIIISEPNSYTTNTTHFMIMLDEIEGLNTAIKRNININDKMKEWANKYKFEFNYYDYSR